MFEKNIYKTSLLFLGILLFSLLLRATLLGKDISVEKIKSASIQCLQNDC